MDNEAGHKRKEFASKSKSAIKNVGGGVKNFWFNWFGDLEVASGLWKVAKYIIYITMFVIIATLGQMFRSSLDSSSKPSKSSAVQSLKETAIFLNKECPKVLDDYTTLTSVTYGFNHTHRIEYIYKVEAIPNEKQIDFQKEKMKNEFCSDPVYDLYIDNNFSMHYTYEDGINPSITIPVSKYDCNISSWKGMGQKLELPLSMKRKAAKIKAITYIDTLEVLMKEYNILSGLNLPFERDDRRWETPYFSKTKIRTIRAKIDSLFSIKVD